MTSDQAVQDINNVLKPWGLIAEQRFTPDHGSHVIITKRANVRRNIGKTPSVCLSEILNAKT